MIGGRKAEARRALATAEMAASGSGLPIFTDGAGAVLRSCQKKAVKRLKSFARVHLYRGAFQARRPVLIQAELRAALDRSSQVAERIRSTFLELGIALVSTQVLRRHGMMTHRAHLPCFTISSACRRRWRDTGDYKRQRDRGNGSNTIRPSHGNGLLHLGRLFNSPEISSARAEDPAGKFRRFLGGGRAL
jgi:hypothetical protein